MTITSLELAKLRTKTCGWIKEIFNNDTATINSQALYNIGNQCYIVSKAAWELGFSESQNFILRQLLSFSSSFVPLSTLRSLYASGLLDLDLDDTDFRDYYKLSPGNSSEVTAVERSGDDSVCRMVNYITLLLGKKRVSEATLVEFNYLVYVAYIIRLILERCEVESRSPTDTEQRCLDIYIPIMAKITLSQWDSTRNGYYYQHYFDTRKDRVKAIIGETYHAPFDPEDEEYLEDTPYYAAVLDIDWFVFHLASELMCWVNSHSELVNSTNYSDLSVDKVAWLRNCRDYGYLTHLELIQFSPVFSYQPGAWYKHPDHDFDGYTGSTYPEDEDSTEYRLTTSTYDTGHFSRVPMMIDAAIASYVDDSDANKSAKIALLQSIQTAIAEQVVENCTVVNSVPLFTNFIDGTNGWFRVNYSSRHTGYCPYAHGRSVIRSPWWYLCPFSSSFRAKMQSVYDMAFLTDSSSVATRTLYYGEDFGARNDNLTTVDSYATIEQIESSTLWINYWCAKALELL